MNGVSVICAAARLASPTTCDPPPADRCDGHERPRAAAERHIAEHSLGSGRASRPCAGVGFAIGRLVTLLSG
jgi:hypothetical protein